MYRLIAVLLVLSAGLKKLRVNHLGFAVQGLCYFPAQSSVSTETIEQPHHS